jgi:hypothetical protein|tara:strand:- start:137 stop:412 length:276 start_codon:yes stop_codon:yes gene_type:complete
MKYIFLLFIWSCGTIHLPQGESPKFNGIPIVDKVGETHNYKSTRQLELNNDYALYCQNHHQWETISVRYTPTVLSKMRREEYVVRRHPKSS